MIGDILPYLIRVILIQFVFYGFYWAVLRKLSNHSLNRTYLLSTILFSFIIPLIHNPLVNKPIEVVNESLTFWIASTERWAVPISNQEEVVSRLSIWGFLLWIYGAITLFYLGRSAIRLYFLHQLKKRFEYVKKTWYKLYRTSNSRPFSFLRNVFIPGQLFGTESYDKVLEHECEHVRQLHSIDRLLMDFLVALLWFNPFIYFYRSALIEVHEFQADAKVLSEFNDPVGYQELIYAQLHAKSTLGLVSHFNFSTIKKRILMMNKPNKTNRWVYLLTLPIIALVFFSFTSRKGSESIQTIANEIEKYTGPFDLNGTDRSVSDQKDPFNPSILPLEPTGKYEVTSEFGKRTDPVSKKTKMHNGTDFKAPMGTVVISPADGEVIEVANKPDGWGKYIYIKHGEKYKTFYGHLSDWKVKVGDKVRKRDVIGFVGSTGRSKDPHLHYEIYVDDKRVNPVDYIKNYSFEKQLPIIREVRIDKSKADNKGASGIEVTVEESKKAEELHEVAKKEMIQAELQREQAIAQEQIAKNQKLIADNQRMALSEKQEADKLRRELEKTRAENELLKKELEVRRREELSKSKLAIRKTEVVEGKRAYLEPDKKPLYVLDGKIVEEFEIAEFDPSNVESINVLKDESATSMYGEKGANGVIIIRTKKK